jgi:hypothetical protein
VSVYGLEARATVGMDTVEVDRPGCYNCDATARSGGVWYMGLDAEGPSALLMLSLSAWLV